MAKCTKCGKHGLFLRVSAEGLCSQCLALVEEERHLAEQRRREEAEAARKRADEEFAERMRLAEERYQQKMRDYEEMVAAIETYPVVISDKPAPKLATSLLNEITYSNITKKTPRDKLGNFVAIDTETTGLKVSTDEIIDVAAIRFRDYRPVCKFSTLLSPKKEIPAEATKINGITNEMVVGKPTFQQVAQSLTEFIGDDNLVGHNLEFDLKFIQKYGVDATAQKRKYYDTLGIARKTIKKARRKWDKEFEMYVTDVESPGIEDYTLGTLCFWYGIPNPKSHRAENDALAVGLLLKKLADDRE